MVERRNPEPGAWSKVRADTDIDRQVPVAAAYHPGVVVNGGGFAMALKPGNISCKPRISATLSGDTDYRYQGQASTPGFI